MTTSRRKQRGKPGIELAGTQWSEGERSEPKRNGGPANSAEHRDGGQAPDPEVLESPKYRRYTAEYKARIVEEADRCSGPGAVGALLRREGLYSSLLSKWREAYRQGKLQALRDDKRGRKRKRHPLEEENQRLRKKLARMERRLDQAQTIIEIQKKVSEMLGIPLKTEEEESE